MSLLTLAETVAKYGAPLLGGAIGGPAGAAIGQLVASEFGGSTEQPEQLVATINGDTQAADKLKGIENTNKTQLQGLVIQAQTNALKEATQQSEIEYLNTKNARFSNVMSKTIMPEIISLIVILGFFASIYLVYSHGQDESNHDILYMLMGTMAAAFGAVINYWLGSSLGSSQKDSVIAGMK